MPSLGRVARSGSGGLASGPARVELSGADSEGPWGCRPAAPGGFTHDRTLAVHPRGGEPSSRVTAGHAAGDPEPGRCRWIPPSGRSASPYYSAPGRREGAEKAGSVRGAPGSKCSGQPRSACSAPNSVRMAPAAPPRKASRAQPQRAPPGGCQPVLPAHAAGQDAGVRPARPRRGPGSPPGRRPLLNVGPGEWLPPAAFLLRLSGSSSLPPTPGSLCSALPLSRARHPGEVRTGGSLPRKFQSPGLRKKPSVTAHPPRPAPRQRRLGSPRRCAALL